MKPCFLAFGKRAVPHINVCTDLKIPDVHLAQKRHIFNLKQPNNRAMSTELLQITLSNLIAQVILLWVVKDTAGIFYCLFAQTTWNEM